MSETWYVVIPFTTQDSAKRALPRIEEASGYLGFTKAAVEDDPPEYDPDDAEAQAIAEDFAQAAAEAHWTDTGEAR